MKSSACGKLTHFDRLSESSGGGFGRDGVDVDAGAELEAGDSSGPGQNLQMPVVGQIQRKDPRSGANDVIVGRLIEQRFDRADQAMHGVGKLDEARIVEFLEPGGVVLWKQPRLEGEPAGEGAQ